MGMKVTLVEPGGYTTDWGGSSAVHATPLPQYDAMRKGLTDMVAKMPSNFIGKAAATGPAILQIVDAAEPPLRIFFGVAPTQMVADVYARRLKTWKDWEPLSIAANGR